MTAAAGVASLRGSRAGGHAGRLTTEVAARAWRLSALALAALALTLVPTAHERSQASVQGPTVSPLLRLPLAARAAISRTLGRDDPAYRVTEAEGGFRVTNQPQGLQSWFSAAGVRVRAGESRFGLSLTGYGSGGTVRPVSSVAPRARANRVEYLRGPLSEWYVNGPLGLEQGFTLSAPPKADRAGPLVLALSLSGNLIPSLEPSGDGVSFKGSSLRYTGLNASDATGRELPAWIELNRRTLLLRVDARGARYPVAIDPFVQQAKLTASDGATSHSFGQSVAVAGDTIVVGAPDATVSGNTRQGGAYVFVKPASGWSGGLTQSAKLTASDGAASNRFGVSVAIAGDTIVVGASSATVGANTRQGAAYVFIKPAGGWSGSLTESAKLTASDGAASDRLGFPVAIAGDTVVASAAQATVGANDHQGKAYVFVKPASGWSGSLTESAKLTASDGAAGVTFGFGVAIAGDAIVAGADGASTAYVFVKPGSRWSGSLTENAKLTASDGTANDGLGFSVAIAGDTVVAGAYQATLGANTWQGAAYVFVKPAAGWSGSLNEGAKLTASDGTSYDMLGYSVAIAGDTVLAGAPHRLFGDNPEQGAAYAFLKPASGWSGTRTEDAKLTASDGAPADFFGEAVALAGNVGVVGSSHNDIFNNPQPGAAYVFDASTFTFLGFEKPLHDRYKPGESIKVAFQVGDGAGDLLSDARAQALVASCAVTAQLDGLNLVCATYDPKRNLFQAKVPVPKTLAPGDYPLTIAVDGTAIESESITIARK
jgi:hypothetical protein